MTSDRRLDAERRLRALLADAGLPAPDEIEHEPGTVVFVWHDTKTVVCVDLADEGTVDGVDGRPSEAQM